MLEVELRTFERDDVVLRPFTSSFIAVITEVNSFIIAITGDVTSFIATARVSKFKRTIKDSG